MQNTKSETPKNGYHPQSQPINFQYNAKIEKNCTRHKT